MSGAEIGGWRKWEEEEEEVSDFPIKRNDANSDLDPPHLF